MFAVAKLRSKQAAHGAAEYAYAQRQRGCAAVHTHTLRQTPPFQFIASPGDRLQFSFWIRSKFTKFNNLEVLKTSVELALKIEY